MKIVLIPDTPVWHKLWSIRFAVLAAAFGALAQLYVNPTTPPDWLPVLPPFMKMVFGYASIISAIASPVSRIVQQANLPSNQPRLITVPPPDVPGEEQTVIVPPLTKADVSR